MSRTTGLSQLTSGLDSYESLPPNFSLLQNMAAGAFAGIAVRLQIPQPSSPPGPLSCRNKNNSGVGQAEQD